MIYSLPTPVNWTLVLWVQEPQRRQGIGEIAGGDSRAIWSAVAEEVITTLFLRLRQLLELLERAAQDSPGDRVCRRKCVRTALADASDQSEERVGKMSL